MTDRGGATTWAEANWPFASSDPLQLPSLYATARRAGDAVDVRLHNGRIAHLVTRHDLVADLLGHPDLSADPHAGGYPAPSLRSLRTKSGQRTLVRLDPPEHTTIRRALLPSLSPGAISHLRIYVDDLARSLVDRVLAPGRGEVVGGLASPLPVLVAARWLGVPDDEARRLARLAQVWAGLSGGVGAASQLHDVIDDYFASQLRLTRGEGWSSTTTTVIRGLVDQGITGARVLGETLSHLFTSALSTVGNSIALTLLALCRYPEQRHALVARGEEGLPQAVEECLRFTCVPRHSALRTATATVQVGDAVISPGSGVIASLAAANRDPHVFVSPDQFDVSRSPNRHLTFAPGTHGCIGSQLARIELGAVLRAIRKHPMAARPWIAEAVAHHMGTTVTVDRLVVRID